MDGQINPLAPHHLPWFITAPGTSDGLFNASVLMLVLIVFAFGLFYLRLHALPEHLAGGASKLQLQLVGVLCLLALFTHNNAFWIAALLLALVRFPDFATPLESMAQSLARLSGRTPPEPLAPEPDPPVAPSGPGV